MIITILIAIFVIVYVRKNISQAKIAEAEVKSKQIIIDAERDAEAKKKEAILEAKEEVHKIRNDFEKESRERRNEIQRLERRIIQREELLDKKSEAIESKEEALNKKQQDINEKETSIDELYEKQRQELERLSNLSSDEARDLLLEETKKEIKHDLAIMIKDMENKAKEEADKKAKEIISTAIQRCAADHVAESTVHVVSLPNDEMKGRIIGREGRNI
ncbi:Rnase Y domain-containing protein, partial [Clostridium botulinum]